MLPQSSVSQDRIASGGTASSICHGASCSGEESHLWARMCRMATDQASAAASSIPLPSSTWGSAQSKPSGLNRHATPDRKSVVWGKSVSVLVDRGGRCIIKKKKKKQKI